MWDNECETETHPITRGERVDDKAWHDWVDRLVDGDEVAIAEFWGEFADPLERFAAQHLTVRLQRRVGPEDVVQSACRTFLRRAQDQQFALSDSKGLWRLLCVITLTKIREHVRFHLRQKRGANREQQLHTGDDDSRRPGHELAAEDPTPAMAAEFADEFAKLLSGLDDEEQQLVHLKLEQHTNLEIADKIGCSERTVRRILKRVQSRLARMLDDA